MYSCLIIIQIIQVTEPFELVGMDLLKLTVTEDGNQYICVMVDYFKNWAEAYPLKNKSAEEVTNCILDFVYKFGVLQRLREWEKGKDNTLLWMC